MRPTYAYLGPEGTFTEAALLQVPEAADAERIPAASVSSALELVRTGQVRAAMVPIENSVEGGVSATLDSIATGDPLMIIGEQLVPIRFVLAARHGLELGDLKRVSTHGHAWAQCRGWSSANIPLTEYIPAASTAAAAAGLLDDSCSYDAAICAPLAAEQLGLDVLADNIGDVEDAVTRFILVSRPGALPEATGSDKTTLVVPLPDDHPGALMGILEQFATRGVNLSRIESRPTGQFLGDYFFSIDADGHLTDERIADAIRGLHRISPGLRFLGSYPRADQRSYGVPEHHQDKAFRDAHEWVRGILDRE
ncbi:prephenate dehydratase [Arthrobacter crystallopoietes BAB-32]|uniref:Prephenate dehydratase n=1 Tax=Arthrobacter crystallopoietes BAB-32 TaxID=1246476 RepID=N1UR12_9MICC|nr:prephenate dehydratase [Arthrobacter crystallopoietes]EMY32841.1 prephenate dehydratase [Arthrobacter crystallopoietes BAB-32]